MPEEALLGRIVPAVPSAGHGPPQRAVLHQLDELQTGGDGYDAGLFQKPIKEFNDLNLEPTVVFIDYLRNFGGTVSVGKAPLPEVVIEKAR